MKTMNISIMIDWISDFYKVSHNISDTGFSFRQIRILEKNAQLTENNFLYLTKNPKLLHIMPDTVSSAFIIFYVEPGLELLPDSIFQSDHILFLYTDESFLTVFRTIQDIFDRYQNWYEQCLHMILEDKTISDFLDHAAIYLDNPIALFDPSGSVLHYTGTFQQDISGTLWEEVTTFGFTPTEFILPDEHKRIMQEIQEGKKLITSAFRQDPSHHALTVPLHVDGKSFGAFGTTDINGPFSDSQKALILDVCQLTELALKRQTKTALLQDEENFYVTRLLQGFQPDERATSYYLKARNYNNEDVWYLYQFPLPEADYAQTRKSSYINQFGRILPNAVLLFFENSIIVICRLSDFDPDQEKCRKKMESLLKRLSIKVLISSRFMQFTDLSIAYRQCQLMEKYAANTCGSIQRFEDSFQQILYGILQENNSLKGFCHPTILSMWQSRSEQNRILIYDLKYYLLNGRNIAETSRYLNLHRNTFIYRLQKMEEQLQLSLDYLDENTLLYLLISCIICETLK